MNELKVGIIGAGMIAEEHIKGFQQIEGVEVSHVAELDENRLAEVGKIYSISNLTNDYRSMLLDASLDAVVICTPPNSHQEIFEECVKAGKHTLVEKPLGMNLEQIDRMIEVSRAHPEVKVMECSARHSRLQPRFRMIKQMIDEGWLGEVYYVHHNCVWRNSRAGIEYHPSAKWFLNKAISGGGPLFDWGVYDLSFHLGVLGDDTQVEAIDSIFTKNRLDNVDSGTDIFDVEEHFSAQITLSKGIKMSWERASNANMEVGSQTRIYGTRGGLKFGYCSWDNPIIEFYDVANDGKGKGRKNQIEIKEKEHDDSLALSKHFVEVLRGNEMPAMPLELARKHLAIIFDCYQKT